MESFLCIQDECEPLLLGCWIEFEHVVKRLIEPVIVKGKKVISSIVVFIFYFFLESFFELLLVRAVRSVFEAITMRPHIPGDL